MKKILTKKGFTLIELIVVIAILAILAAILIPSITNYITEAEEARDMANARSLYSEAVLNLSTGGAIPTLPTGCTSTGTTAETVSITCNGQTAP
jgi:type IV pilus assembly protein PilA